MEKHHQQQTLQGEAFREVRVGERFRQGTLQGGGCWTGLGRGGGCPVRSSWPIIE